MKESEKSVAKLSSPDYQLPNIVTMDKTESKLVMFTKDASFKQFDYVDGKIVENTNFIDEGDGTSLAYVESH